MKFEKVSNESLQGEGQHLSKPEFNEQGQSVQNKSKPFQCKICEFCSTWKENRKAHVASVHNRKKNSIVKSVTTNALEMVT